MRRSREWLYEQIRRDRRLDPAASGRELAEKYKISRNTVAKALKTPVPAVRKAPPPRVSVLAPAHGWIDEMLRADESAPRKQRHTIDRIRARLVMEHDFDLGSYSLVRDYVARRRPQIAAEEREGRRHLEGTVPQEKQPGQEAEVDFADVWVDLAGERVQCVLFTLRMSFSGKAVHRVFAGPSQEAFLEGHVAAFEALGGVPARHIRYDNLRPAVKGVCFGRDRHETTRWVSFRSWFAFVPFYCIPGEEGAHEKGGVEHEGGRFRRKHLVPPPQVETLAELNERLAVIDEEEDSRHVQGRPVSIGHAFESEREHLLPLPVEPYECGLELTPRVARNGRVTVRQSYYSVLARFIGQTVRVRLKANELLVLEGRKVIAQHPRLTRRYAYHDILDHYLEVLRVKPGAFAGAAALAQARTEGTFTPAHDAFWAAAREAHGEREGTRALIEVLLLHRLLPAQAVVAGIEAVLKAGACSPEVVAIEARKAMEAEPEPGSADDGPAATQEPTPDDGPPAAGSPSGRARVISLHTRRELPPDSRPLPSTSVYDRLLKRTTTTTTASGETTA